MRDIGSIHRNVTQRPVDIQRRRSERTIRCWSSTEISWWGE